MRNRFRIIYEGNVQGFGFRPELYRLACTLSLTGFVRNTTGGLYIEAEGDGSSLQTFQEEVKKNSFFFHRITRVTIDSIPLQHSPSFEIRESADHIAGMVWPAADIATCDQCLNELFSEGDRRHHYPFIACSRCGPRYTMIHSLPYDRKNTSMKAFSLCLECEKEYHNSKDRRFHSQPISCGACGPLLRLISIEDRTINIVDEKNPIDSAAQLLSLGKILAVQGLGGFHLCCDACNAEAVSQLRKAKRNSNKPFAVMVRDSSVARDAVILSQEDEEMLLSAEHPIILLPWNPSSALARDKIAPGCTVCGIMLPYTGLHHLLLQSRPAAIVATSGNRSDEPICLSLEEAIEDLGSITSYFLVHTREILHRTDDSVLAKTFYGYLPIRRSRGFIPLPIPSPVPIKLPILACGGDLKNVFGLGKEDHLFLSPHIGDLSELEARTFFLDTISHFSSLLKVEPSLITADLHPDYFSRHIAEKISEEKKIPLIPVQHHHAHLASVMAEHRLEGDCIGVCFDGTGYGEDGTSWGGEILVGGYKEYYRAATLFPFHLPGGDVVARSPWRSAIAILYGAYGMEGLEILKRSTISFPHLPDPFFEILEEKINSPLSSSAGRLFDAFSALASIRMESTYEGEAAILFQGIGESASSSSPLPFSSFRNENNLLMIDWRPALTAFLKGLEEQRDVSSLSADFHSGLAHAVYRAVCEISRETNITNICFSGGVMQNTLFLNCIRELLQGSGLLFFFHTIVPANDGGIALGQMMIANAQKE
ncbi:MAG: carbamoyltransferase HypF [Candidatus Ratteibacteria bacterium]